MRKLISLIAVGVIAASLPAGDEPLAGNWKLNILEDGQLATLWIVRLESKAGKWSGAADALKGVPETKLGEIQLDGDLIHFDLRLKNGVGFQFEGRMPRAGAKKVLGSITRDGKSI